MSKPTEYFVVWEEEQNAGSLSAATRLARRKVREGKGAVQVRRRVDLQSYRDDDATEHWIWYEDEMVQDAFDED